MNEKQEFGIKGSKIFLNTAYKDDCYWVFKDMKKNSVDLIYLDPPFSEQKNIRYGFGPGSRNKSDTKGEIFKGGNEGYIRHWLAARIVEMKEVLKPTGSIFLHLDAELNPLARIMMDEIFGKNNFKNQIIWNRQISSKAKKQFIKGYDMILFYGKSAKTNFYMDQVLIPHLPSTENQKGRLITSAPFLGAAKKDRIFPRPEEGKSRASVWDINTPRANSPEGRDVEVIRNGITTVERATYRTQKPEALLDIIIKATTKPGDVVMDPFAGSGTTGVVAKKLNRNWLLVDTCKDIKIKEFKKDEKPKIIRIENAKNVMEYRLKTKVVEKRSQAKFIHGKRKVLITDWLSAEKAVCKAFGVEHTGGSGDLGIDGQNLSERKGVQVKYWADKVGPNEVRAFFSSLARAKFTYGILATGDYTKGTQNFADELSKLKFVFFPDVKPIKMENINIDVVRLEDI